ncbi:progesterone binding protein [Stylonychia lemnae]|uniref:Progesterone binding protein n=1 Tax=Stylonychia lemnae TaxID=5949 RepID=A0A078APK7_STYLE|nr:progesterone binding protein [Stylonychia lemnae]|eukprot:CDW83247.1 progesterone binding protein [Stylonychia lemnae]
MEGDESQAVASQPMMTFEELAKFDGIQSEKVYMALKGQVYDVSGSDFYKPGGPYHVFAGKDASVGLAIMSKEPEFTDPKKHSWKDLAEADKIILDNWVTKLSQKYPLVGILASLSDD